MENEEEDSIFRFPLSVFRSHFFGLTIEKK
jgi:hypothetical protein